MSSKFVRRIENFVCTNCGISVKSTGFTNHCPKCLWSKHVDINPGDRLSPCRGMMEPCKIELEKGEYIITHKCTKCGIEKKNKSAENDNFEEIVRVISLS
jgi:predicted RNA-binding Zn-ribbon protein involved in translation (DUF1610 family)